MMQMTLLPKICSALAPKVIDQSELGKKRHLFLLLYGAPQVLVKSVISLSLGW